MSLLVEHARKHNWCNPRADMPYSAVLSPISGFNGYKTMVPEPWGMFHLPNLDDGFVLYQLGYNSYSRLGITKHLNYGWNCVADLMKENNFIIDIYDQLGLMVSRKECWMWCSHNGNMLLAVRRSEVTDVLVRNKLRIRFYRNAWLASSGSVDKIDTDAIYVNTDDDKIHIWNGWNDHNKDGKHATLFVNGYQKDGLLPNDLNKGDMVEWVYDPSIKFVLEYPVKDLRSFTSDLDKKLKWYFHIPKAYSDCIEFVNDFDVAFSHDGGATGIYYAHREAASLRMLSHHDFSLPLSRKLALENSHNCTFDKVIVRVRNGGMCRDLPFEANRLNELYKQSDDDIIEQMVGSEVIIPEWAAVNLEKSMYTKLMGVYDVPITESEVIESYGYNGVVKVTEPNPTIITDGDNTLHPSLGFSKRASFFCYDVNGELLDILPDRNGDDIPLPDGTTLVDSIYGRIGDRCDAMLDEVVSDLVDGIQYHFYYRRIRFGKPIEDWQVAVEGEHYRISNSRVTWLIDVRSNNTLVINSKVNPYFVIAGADNLLRIRIPDVQTNTEGKHLESNLFAQCDVWMNNKALIENIDYKLVHPYIHLYNKTHFNGKGNNDFVIKVVLSSFRTEKTPRMEVGDVGFTRHGKVSHNHIYDVREANNVICNLGGCIIPNSRMGFSEDEYLPKSVDLPNGIPYQIKQRKGVGFGTTMDVDVEFPKARELDKQVSKYFTIKYPEPPHKSFSFIDKRYTLVSGLMNKLIFDLVNNKLLLPDGRLTDSVIEDILIKYQMLLADDVCLFDFGTWFEMVEIQPHILKEDVVLAPRQFEFVKRVNALYLNNCIMIERFIKIERV